MGYKEKGLQSGLPGDPTEKTWVNVLGGGVTLDT